MPKIYAYITTEDKPAGDGVVKVILEDYFDYQDKSSRNGVSNAFFDGCMAVRDMANMK